MGTHPTFSVVIAAHNAAKTLPATLASVQRQTRSDFEVVVVDDGSTDETRATVERFVEELPLTYVRQDNLGPAIARNAGVELSRGKYVAILDSDDLWLPTYLASVATAFSQAPSASLAYTDAWRLDEETRRIHRRTIMSGQKPPRRTPRDSRRLLELLLRGNFVYTSATVRRSTLLEVGGFQSFTRSEDYELWLRIAASGAEFTRAGGVLAVYRDRPGSRIHDPAAMLQGRCEIYRHVVDTYEVSPETKRVAEARVLEIERQLRAVATADGSRPSAWRTWPVVRRARDLRLYYLRPPPAVAAAFPDLRLI